MKSYIVVANFDYTGVLSEREFDTWGEAKRYAHKFSGICDMVICESDPDQNGTYRDERSYRGMLIVAQFWAVE